MTTKYEDVYTWQLLSVCTLSLTCWRQLVISLSVMFMNADPHPGPVWQITRQDSLSRLCNSFAIIENEAEFGKNSLWRKAEECYHAFISSFNWELRCYCLGFSKTTVKLHDTSTLRENLGNLVPGKFRTCMVSYYAVRC